MEEYQFLVKVEGYREALVTSCGNNIEEAESSLIDKLNVEGLNNINYIVPA